MKYNKSEIMKKAWAIKKGNTKNIFSECLKMAWAFVKKETRKVIEKMEEIINLEKVKFAAQEIIKDTLWEKVSFTEWNNYGKSRVYIKAIRYTPAGNPREHSFGYWDNQKNEYVVGKRETNVFTDKDVFN